MDVPISEIDTVEKLAIYYPDLFEELVKQGEQQFLLMFETARKVGVSDPLKWAKAQLN